MAAAVTDLDVPIPAELGAPRPRPTWTISDKVRRAMPFAAALQWGAELALVVCAVLFTIEMQGAGGRGRQALPFWIPGGLWLLAVGFGLRLVRGVRTRRASMALLTRGRLLAGRVVSIAPDRDPVELAFQVRLPDGRVVAAKVKLARECFTRVGFVPRERDVVYAVSDPAQATRILVYGFARAA